MHIFIHTKYSEVNTLLAESWMKGQEILPQVVSRLDTEISNSIFSQRLTSFVTITILSRDIKLFTCISLPFWSVSPS